MDEIEAVAREMCVRRGYDPDALGWWQRVWSDGQITLAPTTSGGELIEPQPIWMLLRREAEAAVKIVEDRRQMAERTLRFG